MLQCTGASFLCVIIRASRNFFVLDVASNRQVGTNFFGGHYAPPPHTASQSRQSRRPYLDLPLCSNMYMEGPAEAPAAPRQASRFIVRDHGTLRAS